MASVRPLVGCSAYSDAEFQVGGVFEDAADRSGLHHLVRKRLVLVHRGDHDLRPGRPVANVANALHRASVGHPRVEHEDVRAVGLQLAGEGLEIACLGDDLDVGFTVEQCPQAAANRDVIIGE